MITVKGKAFSIGGPFVTSRRNTARYHSRIMAVKKVLVPIAHGSEEIEAVCIIDVLRRSSADVTVASVEDTLQVNMSRQVKLVADVSIADVIGVEFDLIALPGGMPGAERLRDSKELHQLLLSQMEHGRIVAAMCASPAVVLEAKGFLDGKAATCHPAFAGELQNQSHVPSRVVVDGKTITSRAPGTALEYALALVAALFGPERAAEVAGPMVMHDYDPAKHV